MVGNLRKSSQKNILERPGPTTINLVGLATVLAIA